MFLQNEISNTTPNFKIRERKDENGKQPVLLVEWTKAISIFISWM